MKIREKALFMLFTLLWGTCAIITAHLYINEPNADGGIYIYLIFSLATVFWIRELVRMKNNYTVFDEEGVLFVRDGVEEYYEWDKYEVLVYVYRIFDNKTIIIWLRKGKEVKLYYVSYSRKLLPYLKGLRKGLHISE